MSVEAEARHVPSDDEVWAWFLEKSAKTERGFGMAAFLAIATALASGGVYLVVGPHSGWADLLLSLLKSGLTMSAGMVPGAFVIGRAARYWKSVGYATQQSYWRRVSAIAPPSVLIGAVSAAANELGTVWTRHPAGVLKEGLFALLAAAIFGTLWLLASLCLATRPKMTTLRRYWEHR